VNHSAAYNAGQTFGMIAMYVGILAIGIYFGHRLGKKRNDGIFVRWPVGVALAIDLLAMLGQCTAPVQAQTVAPSDVVVEQRVGGSSTGFPNTFDADFLRRFNDGVHDGAVNALRKRGLTVTGEEVNASTQVVSFGGHKVLKSKVAVPSRLFAYQFAGASKGQVVLVICSSRTAHPFEATGTDCENHAAKAYGF
jgi:hypothetical protein